MRDLRPLAGLLVVLAATPAPAQNECRDKPIAECLEKISALIQGFDEEFIAVLSQIHKAEMPVGSIVTSTLTPDQFRRTENPQYDKDKWIPADGRALPEGSIYQQLTGQAYAPDLRRMQEAKVLLDVVSGHSDHGQLISQLYTPKYADAQWYMHFGLRDITGKRYNGDWEHAEDQFQIIPDSGAIVAQGRTFNIKHGIWGPWKEGYVSYFGLGVIDSPFFYYVKIN